MDIHQYEDRAKFFPIIDGYEKHTQKSYSSSFPIDSLMSLQIV